MLRCRIMANGDDKEHVTKQMLDEAIDAILEGMSKLVGGLENKMNTRFDNVENRLQKVETEISYVKDEMNGLKADFSTTLSRRELEELRQKVDKALSN